MLALAHPDQVRQTLVHDPARLLYVTLDIEANMGQTTWPFLLQGQILRLLGRLPAQGAQKKQICRCEPGMGQQIGAALKGTLQSLLATPAGNRPMIT